MFLSLEYSFTQKLLFQERQVTGQSGSSEVLLTFLVSSHLCWINQVPP